MSAIAEAKSIETLQPTEVWRIFSGLAQVPRPSKQEERVRQHVKDWAERRGLSVRQDDIGNLVISAPASAGYEGSEPVVLQAHLDMVCEKNRDTQHDFDSDGIHLLLDEDGASGKRIVRADGTTLGADNGIGVAMALAAATSPEVVHGPLELLFTIDEEAGMSGAKALTPASFRGRRLLNLDSEEDDCIYIGCAGGADTNLTWRMKLKPADRLEDACVVHVEGLRGGHSGGDIHKGRANAIQLLTRVLTRVERPRVRIAEITGGSKRNAIPREAMARVAGRKGLLEALRTAAEAVRQEAIAESYESDIAIRVERIKVKDVGGVASPKRSWRILRALSALPNGVLGMHPRVSELVQTSNNISTVESHRADGRLEISVGTLSRSLSDSALEVVKQQIASIGRLAGARVAHGNQYPGWEPNVESATLGVCRRAYSDLFGEEPQVKAIHAGLECGIIGKLVGDMDMVSFGPTIHGAHSPEERVFVDSVAKSWQYLVAVLKELARG